MKDCKIDTETMRCVWCGRDAPAVDLRRNCRMGLGDRLEQILTGIGITKARMQAVTGKPCACEERKQRLNEIGARLFGMG